MAAKTTKPFLLDVAQELASAYKDFDKLTVVFPNQRAALYFRHYLTHTIEKPTWSPQLTTIEDFFGKLSGMVQLDQLDLAHRIYRIYQTEIPNQETFDQFYFWGNMLLQDFDELDKYLVNPKHLFKDLSRIKELDEVFDYLTDEQKEFLTRFWNGIREKHSFNKEQFLAVWKKLGAIYDKLVNALKKEGAGYEGLIQRMVIERLQDGKLKIDFEKRQYVFVGFNALTLAEQTLLEHCALQGSKIYWDADDYYVNDARQEAGKFFRQYKEHTVLGRTLPETFPANIQQVPKNIQVTAVPHRISQVKLLNQDLDLVSIESVLERGGNTAIILPDESLLLSVLHSLPPTLESVNITMGFPLRNTPMFNLLDLMLDLQINRRGSYFNHRTVLAILSHAYVQDAVGGLSQQIRKEIIDKNRVYVPVHELVQNSDVLKMIFEVVESGDVTAYLLNWVQYLGATFPATAKLPREYAFHFHRMLARLGEVLLNNSAQEAKHVERLKGYQKLFRQIVQAQKIPFVGEPLKGIQVMGVLETRNLDFENVFLLSMNEGNLPASAKQGSYIPQSVRKAYGMPAADHHDATYAYLFYRLFQRSAHVSMYFNSETDVLGNGEMSRYLRQLQTESELPVKLRVLANKIQLKDAAPISFKQSQKSLEYLQRFTEEGEKTLSPSTLNDYIECGLRFYLKHIAGFREADEVEEELDARVMGLLLHDVLHHFYSTVKSQGRSGVMETDFYDLEMTIANLIDNAFIEHYHLDSDKPVLYEGQRLVVREVVKDFALRILSIDKAYAPFEVISLEDQVHSVLQVDPNLKVRMGGKIDRIDRKENVLRIVDYKTGKDELGFESIESLFDATQKRSKAAFQTFYYSLAYSGNLAGAESLQPGLFNRSNLFKNEFKFGHIMKGSREPLLDVRYLMPEFEQRLKALLANLYNPDHQYIQTENRKNCEYCNFKNLCRR